MAQDGVRDAVAPGQERTGIQRIAARYGSHWQQSYARGKLRHDPAFAAVAERVLPRHHALLDIGCGMGLLGQYLRECGHRGAYLGIDLDAGKIDAAKRAALELRPALDFMAIDASALPAFHGDVAMLDVLHYLHRDQQLALLHEAAARVAEGGLLIVRNVLREDNWRFHVTRIEEAWLRLVGWMRTAVRHYPDAREVTTALRAAGLAVSLTPLWGRTPFNSYLIVATRDATGVGARP
ncbi:MAG TPA: class I SAM-dependent methyltransferase [Rhodanobacteraceae bacterium]|jgi:SAM-dependent methyltransferase|nr:class I SAM-dependent methyltransferase [Rhodanobacteraceae bacterium]